MEHALFPLRSASGTFVLRDGGSAPPSPDFIGSLKLTRGSACWPLLRQRGGVPMDAFYFSKRADGAVSISVGDKKQHAAANGGR